MKFILSLSVLIFPILAGTAQSLQVSGKITGAARPGIQEVQFYANGQSKKLPVDKEQGTFKGELNIKKAQFLEIKTGSSSDFIYVLPGETLVMNIDKPTFVETNMELESGTIKQLKTVMDRFYASLNENGINPKERDWVKELFRRHAIAVSPSRRPGRRSAVRRRSLMGLYPNSRALLSISPMRSKPIFP